MPLITRNVVRTKNLDADLKKKYPRVFWICTGISFGLHMIVAVVYPTFDISAA